MTTPLSDDVELDLAERIVEELGRKPSQTAAELATALGAEPDHVSHCLNQTLVRRVHRDPMFRWRRTDVPGVAATPEGEAETEVLEDEPQEQLDRGPVLSDSGGPVLQGSSSEVSRLCNYYLECIGFDIDTGASAFARGKGGVTDYAELPALPLVLEGHLWYEEDGVEEVLRRVQAKSHKLVAWLGYPVSLRKHEAANWKGYFVEPVLLWPIVFSKDGKAPPEIADDSPVVNAKFLRNLAMGDSQSLAAEAAQLAEDIGLNVPFTKTPTADELIDALLLARPEWNWRERMLPASCSGPKSLGDINDEGIYNRAVVMFSEKSPFTQGLENELAELARVPEEQLHGTALESWLKNSFEPQAAAEDAQPLIEVVPMNTEQRAAVRAAMTEPLTVVTGPPGTGKSQVVTNILVNAAWRNMRVLFASKNNKAVDVVSERVNNLGSRPVLLRLGANDSQARLADYLTQVLAASHNIEDQLSFDDAQARHVDLSQQLASQDDVLQQTLAARNAVDRLDALAESARAYFGEMFTKVDPASVEDVAAAVDDLEKALQRANPNDVAWYLKLLWFLLESRRKAALASCWAEVEPLRQWLGLSPNMPTTDAQWRSSLARLHELATEYAKAGGYQAALSALSEAPSFEDVARRRLELTAKLGQQSAKLWRDWVKLSPARLSAAQRKSVADFLAVHQAVDAEDGYQPHNSMRHRQRALQEAVSSIFTCWAVTSLSARGRIPLEPGYFDLVVIDEASQCDIASVLPLLYRAKRVVVIGDPMQLRHISSVTRAHDSALQHKYALTERHVGWMYSVSSLYDLGAGLAHREDIHSLRDHHRSHADIISFSNRFYYENRLRVATKAGALKTPEGHAPGVVWQHVAGQVTKASRSGASNLAEAKAVVAALVQLLVVEAYPGSVGVVTPFRAQAHLLQELVAAEPKLTACRSRNDLLVETVHRFQGDERDVMFFSPVYAKGIPDSAVKFLRYNGNLFNVAITRARSLLHVVGDRVAAEECDVTYLAQFARYCEQLNAGDGEEEDLYVDASAGDVEQSSTWERQFYARLQAAGLRPIPQFSVEHYQLNFALIVGSRRLNIEVDSAHYHQSWTGDLCLRDQLRNQRLMELGWDVKRFWVWDLRDDMERCVAWVADWAEAARRASPVAQRPRRK